MSRILMLSCQFMPDVFGGAEQQCLKQSVELVARGHEVTVVTSRKSLKTPAHEIMQGVYVRRFLSYRGPDLLGRYCMWSVIWTMQLILFAFRERNKDGEKFVLVHCHQGKFGAFAGAVVSRILGVPQIIKLGNSGAYMDLRALVRKKLVGPTLVNMTLRNKPIFVAISMVIAQDLRDFHVPEEQIAQIVNGVLPHKAVYKPADKKLRNFFWHGRFERIKNLELMINAFAIACQSNKNLTLSLIGGGSYQGYLEKLAREQGIRDKVKFLPPSKTILKDIEQFDIFINTSHAEGMSNSMLEAMACGKAIVSTRVSGTDEIVDEGVNGFVVAKYEAEEISQAILSAAQLTPAEMEQVFEYSIKKTEKLFAIPRVVDQYVELYQRLGCLTAPEPK